MNRRQLITAAAVAPLAALPVVAEPETEVRRLYRGWEYANAKWNEAIKEGSRLTRIAKANGEDHLRVEAEFDKRVTNPQCAAQHDEKLKVVEAPSVTVEDFARKIIAGFDPDDAYGDFVITALLADATRVLAA